MTPHHHEQQAASHGSHDMNSPATQSVMFLVMWVMGVCFNPMNALAYRREHLYFSTTLAYAGLLMASNMMWAHQIVHGLTGGAVDPRWAAVGLAGSGISVLLLRTQFLVSPRQWLRRMLPHHSTALTTTSRLLEAYASDLLGPDLTDLAEDILETQVREIETMQNLLDD